MKLIRKNLFLGASAVFTVALTAPSARAVDFYWDGLTGNWGTVGDWSTTAAGTANPAAIPASTTTANLFFNITSKNTSGSDNSLGNASRSAASLTFNTTGTTNFRAGGSSTANSTLNIGAGGITINALAGSVVLGVTPTSFGALTTNLSADQIWTNNGAGTLTVNGAVTGGAGIDLTKSGTGTVRLNGANTYSGTTTVNNGILQIANYNGLDNTSSITVSGGGTSNLQLVQVGTGTTSNSIDRSLSLHGTLSTAGGSGTNRLNQTWVGDITLAGASTITNNGNSLFDINGEIDLGAHTLTYQADGTGSRIDGNIIGVGGALSKTSSQDLLLTGTNSYTGGTTISAGRLQFADLLAMPATGAVAVNASTLAVNVGGTGEWTTGTSGNGTIGGLLAGLGGQAGSTVNYSGAVFLGLDTTNASPATQIYSGVIGDVGTSLGITKLGTNTLTLDQANTYSGNTAIIGGTLKLGHLSALGTSALVTVGSSTTLQAATASAFSGPALTLQGGTILSDQASPGVGLTHIFGNAAVSNSTHNFTGANATDGNAGIQIGSITNASGSGGSATFNPTTANLVIAGGYTGVTNAGSNNLILGGSAATNSLTGDITLGSRANINVSKTGNSVWTLSGNNSVSLGVGSTLTVSGGALIATTLNALPNSGAATFNGGTIAARVGGAGWTTGEVDTFLAAATKTSGALGIDTTNGSLTQWTDFTTTNLGSTLGLTKLGTNNLTLNSAANNYAGATLVSEGTLEMTVDHALAGGLTFGYANGTTSATGTLDLNNVNAIFGALNVDGNSITAYGIQIDSGKSLTINGNVQIGATTPGVTSTFTKLAMTGGGEFVSNGTTFLVGGMTSGAGGPNASATLDLSGLSKATITTSGNFRIAPNTGTNVGGDATLLLPTPVVADTVATTTITSGGAQGISVGNGGSNNGSSTVTPPMNTLQLGTGLTKLNAASINIASNPVSGSLRDNGRIIYGQASGDLIVRAADGTSRMASINLGTVSVAQTTAAWTSPSVFDVSGHDADILVDTINIGNGHNRTADATYEFKFGAGDNSLASVLDATSVNIGTRAAGNTATTTLASKLAISGGTVTLGNVGATGTGVSIGNSAYDQAGAATFDSQLNISAGTITIHNGSGGFAVRIGQSTAANSGIVNASMNITGGTTTLKGDIVRGTATGTVNSALTLNGASAILDLDGNDITNVTGITYTAGTLKNLGTVNTGMTLAGTGSRIFDQGTGVNGEIQGDITGSGLGLTKQGDGTLKLSGTSSYTGATDVDGGTLIVNGNISTSTLTTVDAGATLSGTGTVGKAIINGTYAPGASPGTMTFTDALTLAGTAVIEIDGTAGAGATGGHDFTDLTGVGAAGELTYGGAMTLDMGMIFNPGSYSWNLFDMASKSGTFATITLVDQYSGSLLDTDLNGVWDLTAANGFGDFDTWTFTESTGVLGLTVIPEPNIAALLGGLGMLALLRRRR